MAIPTEPAVSSISLPDDVWDDLAEFRELVCMAIDILHGESDDRIYKNTIKVISGVIAQDATKPYALVDVVHDKIITRPAWANIVAIKFYKYLFSELDLSFIEDTDFSQSTISGMEAVVKSITDKCVVDIERSPDWTVPPVTSIIAFVEESFEASGNFVSVKAVSYVLTRMSESPYLFFEDNLETLLDFYLRVVPRINEITPSGRLEQVERSLLTIRDRDAEGDPSQISMVEDALRMMTQQFSTHRIIAVQGDVFTIPVRMEEIEREVRYGLVLFSIEPDWGCRDIVRIIDGVSEHTKIGA